MSNVVIDASMSLDGFMAGPDVSVEHPMGIGGERLHEWLFRDPISPVDEQAKNEAYERTGAVVLGRRTFDLGVDIWGDTPFPVPCVVLTHRPREPRVEKSGTFTFVDDVASAHRLAIDAAGDKDVRLMGARASQAFLQAGLVDEIRVQLVPLLLGDGQRLFDRLSPGQVALERISHRESPAINHLRYRVLK